MIGCRPSTVLITVIPDVHATTNTLHELSWEAFAGLLIRHEYGYTHKKAAHLISPAEFYPGLPRTKDNVRRVHFGLLDFDDAPAPRVTALLSRMQAAGEAFVFYTSWSHYEVIPQGKVRGRLCIPFTEPVEAWEWPAVWKRLQRHTENLGDISAKDASRGYFVPSAPRGTEHLSVAVSNPGAPFRVNDPNALSPVITGAPVVPNTSRRLTMRDLQALLRTAKAGKGEHKQWLRDALTKLIGGESLAGEGGRNNTTYKLAANLLDEWPDANPESLVDLFVPSLQAMYIEAPDSPTREHVLDQINRKQGEKATAEAVQEFVSLEERKRAIRTAFELETGRDWPYTAAELEQFAAQLGVKVPDLKQFWIIQKHTGFYVFCAGQYKGPFTQVELEKACQQWLTPAFSAGVELYYTTSHGEQEPKDWQTLVREYGTLATQVCISLIAQQSTYDRKNFRLVEAPCPLRPLEPRYDGYIARWLDLLAGEQATKLLDWIAVITKLDEPCAAVYLEGAKGVGKSLLANGLARLWTERSPIPIEDVMGNAFNSLVIECPLVFADESMPRGPGGKTQSGPFRRLIQARHHTLKRKYIADATIEGSLRFIMAANNSELLNSNEYLTPDDVAAITDRVLHIDATLAFQARDYLNSIPKEYRNQWVRGDMIARHALWLRDNRAVDTSHRFLVSGGRTRLHDKLTTSSGIRSQVCQWLVSYLLEPRPVNSTRELLVRVYNRELLVNIRGLIKHWQIYLPQSDVPETGVLSGALTGISTGRPNQKTKHDGGNHRIHYWAMDTANLVAWADSTGYATKEAIEYALLQDTVLAVNGNGGFRQ